MRNLRERGFVNYFGLQRFGMIGDVPPWEVGAAILLGRKREAVELLLK